MNELTFSKNNTLIRMAGTYPIYETKRIDNICRLGRRILMSLFMTLFLTFGIFGLGIIFMGMAHPENHILLSIATICGAFILFATFAVAMAIVVGGISFLLVGGMFKLGETSTFKRLLAHLKLKYCTTQINYSGILFNIASRYSIYNYSIDNTCRMYRRFCVSIAITILGTLAILGAITLPITIFLNVNPDNLPWLLLIANSLGTIIWGLAIIIGVMFCIDYTIEKIGDSENSTMVESKKILSEIKDAHDRKICKLINIKE